MVIIIYSNFLMLDQVFLSSQVKQSVIISNKHGIYDELPPELPNDVGLRI